MTERMRYSLLKSIALSPLHLRHASEHPIEPTKAMRIGTYAHADLLGATLPVTFDGTRRGKAWEAFKAEHPGAEIVTEDEAIVGANCAKAVRLDPVAMPYFAGYGTNEDRIDWTFFGVPFRSTPDRYVPGTGTLVELKTTRSAEPGMFLRDAMRRHYHVQLGIYAEALRSLGHDVREAVIVAVETVPPFAVAVFRLSPNTLEAGMRTAVLWIEQYKQHAATATWPSYSQTTIEWDLSPDPDLDFGDDEDDAEAA